MVRRISGKYKANTVSHLIYNNNDITDVKEICNTLAVYQCSSVTFYLIVILKFVSRTYNMMLTYRRQVSHKVV